METWCIFLTGAVVLQQKSNICLLLMFFFWGGRKCGTNKYWVQRCHCFYSSISEVWSISLSWSRYVMTELDLFLWDTLFKDFFAHSTRLAAERKKWWVTDSLIEVNTYGVIKYFNTLLSSIGAFTSLHILVFTTVNVPPSDPRDHRVHQPAENPEGLHAQFLQRSQGLHPGLAQIPEPRP